MRGLVLKDLYLLKGLGKQFGIILAFLFLYSMMIQSFSFMIIYFVVMCASMVMSTMSYDESVSFNRFALTTPIQVKTLIGAKYVLILLIMLGGAGISCLFNILSHFFAVTDQSFVFEWGGIAATVAVFMVVNAASLPAMFKLGAEKARYIYIFCMLLIGGVITGGYVLCEKMGISLQELEVLSEQVITIILFAIAVVSMIISYFISVKIVKNKEW